MSDTPRTDAVRLECRDGHSHAAQIAMLTDHARKLERELMSYQLSSKPAARPTMWETLMRWLDLSRSDVEFSLMEWEVEELIEMAKNAKRYQWIRGADPSKVETLIYSYGGAALDAAIDDEMTPLSMGGE